MFLRVIKTCRMKMKIRQRGEGILTANVSGRLMGVVVRWDLGIFGGGREDEVGEG